VELDVDAVRRVALDVDADELRRRLVLCYTGDPHNSGTNNWEIFQRHISGDPDVFDCFERIRDTAVEMRRALEAADWDGVGRALATEWEHRKRLAPGVSTPAIDDLIERAKQVGATAAKVCGAGGGGCMVAFGPPDRRDAIKAALSEGGAKVLDFQIERHGLTRG
jgi:D-glycero-alpha-D-manno-heptose-7-phosphate kinase